MANRPAQIDRECELVFIGKRYVEGTVFDYAAKAICPT